MRGHENFDNSNKKTALNEDGFKLKLYNLIS